MLIKERIDTSLMYVHTLEYYMETKIHGLELYMSAWINFKNLIVREKKQIVKVMY